MHPLSGFIRAVISDGITMFLTLLSIASVLVGLAHASGAVPVWAMWLLGYIALVVAAARIWHNEYRQPGPEIDLEFPRREGRDDNLILYNRSSEDAYDVKIDDIDRGDDANASFDIGKVRGGETVSFKPTVKTKVGTSFLFRSRLVDFILSTSDASNLKEALEGTVFPVRVEYMNIHGQRYESTFEITVYPHMEHNKVVFKSYRRVFKPLISFPRLSKHGR